MHYTRGAQSGFFHHGDYEGEVHAEYRNQEVRADFSIFARALSQEPDAQGLVRIEGQSESGEDTTLALPLEDVQILVSARVESELISELEQLPHEQILARYGAERIARWTH